VKLNIPRFNGGVRHTDTYEFLFPGVTIAYKRRPNGTTYPTSSMRSALKNAAVEARSIVRRANDQLAKVIFLRCTESQWFTDTMARHFNLKSGDLGGGAFTLSDNVVDKKFSLKDIPKHDRRWVLEKIRERMLSLSFHLNTPYYLIDIDNPNRTVVTGQAGTIPAGTEGYVSKPDNGSLFCGFKNGEIHISFLDFLNYTEKSCARVIIHEAAHKFLGVSDKGYAWDPAYPPSLEDCMNNADSIAWTAISLASQSEKMDTGSSTDWQMCR